MWSLSQAYLVEMWWVRWTQKARQFNENISLSQAYLVEMWWVRWTQKARQFNENISLSQAYLVEMWWVRWTQKAKKKSPKTRHKHFKMKSFWAWKLTMVSQLCCYFAITSISWWPRRRGEGHIPHWLRSAKKRDLIRDMHLEGPIGLQHPTDKRHQSAEFTFCLWIGQWLVCQAEKSFLEVLQAKLFPALSPLDEETERRTKKKNVINYIGKLLFSYSLEKESKQNILQINVCYPSTMLKKKKKKEL